MHTYISVIHTSGGAPAAAPLSHSKTNSKRTNVFLYEYTYVRTYKPTSYTCLLPVVHRTTMIGNTTSFDVHKPVSSARAAARSSGQPRAIHTFFRAECVISFFSTGSDHRTHTRYDFHVCSYVLVHRYTYLRYLVPASSYHHGREYNRLIFIQQYHQERRCACSRIKTIAASRERRGARREIDRGKFVPREYNPFDVHTAV